MYIYTTDTYDIYVYIYITKKKGNNKLLIRRSLMRKSFTGIRLNIYLAACVRRNGHGPSCMYMMSKLIMYVCGHNAISHHPPPVFICIQPSSVLSLYYIHNIYHIYIIYITYIISILYT